MTAKRMAVPGLTTPWDFEHVKGNWCCPYNGCDWKKHASRFANETQWATELNAHYETHALQFRNVARVLDEIHQERRRQHAKWGEQNVSDFEWISILTEEVGEAAKEANEGNFASGKGGEAIPRLRAELIQVAAVAVAWVEAIDRRNGHINLGGTQ